jgi:hypothetical protein
MKQKCYDKKIYIFKPNIFLKNLKSELSALGVKQKKKNDKTFILINAFLNFSLECIFGPYR